MLGCRLIGLNEPSSRDQIKKLIVYVEMDRCTADADGYVADLDPLALGRVTVDLGGGRRQPTDAIDPGVGLVLHKKVGDPITAGETWAEIHAADDAAVAAVTARLAAALTVTAEPPPTRGIAPECAQSGSGRIRPPRFPWALRKFLGESPA